MFKGRSSRSGFASIALVLVGIVILALGAYFVWQKNLSGTTAPPVASQPVPDETANWKTYTNTQYGFEVKYPPDWKIAETKSSSEVHIKSPSNNQPDISIFVPDGIRVPSGCPFNTHEIECKILTNKNGTSYIREISTGQLQLDKQQQLNGFFESSKLSVQFLALLTDENGNATPRSQKTVEVFDQILLTFKFTSPQADTSGWKTYRNDKDGFEMKYPPDWSFDVNAGGLPFVDIHLSNKTTSTSDAHPPCVSGFAAMEIQVGHKKEVSGNFESFVHSQVLSNRTMGASGEVSKIELNNKTAFRVESSGWEVSCSGPGYFIEQDPSHYAYVFTGSYESKNQLGENTTIKKILSTFKFANP